VLKGLNTAVFEGIRISSEIAKEKPAGAGREMKRDEKNVSKNKKYGKNTSPKRRSRKR